MEKPKVEMWILLLVAMMVTFVLLIAHAYGQERGWEQEIENKLRVLEDCSYIERFRGSPEERDAQALCHRKRTQAQALRKKLEGGAEMGNRGRHKAAP